MDPLNTLLLSTVTFLIGLLVGNRLAIGRDRRKEWNEDVAPVREKFLRARLRPSPYSESPSLQELDLVARHFSRWKRARFERDVKEYSDKCELYIARGKSGGVKFSDSQEIARIIRNLLNKYLEYSY